MLDVGSGAGLPGVVIAGFETRVEVVCVDSVGKKAAFITQAASALGLTNLTAAHRRVEDDMPGERFDVITSRAFASLADFFGCDARSARRRGRWMAMKGNLPSDELAACRFGVSRGTPPCARTRRRRCIVWVQPSTQISASSQQNDAVKQ